MLLFLVTSRQNALLSEKTYRKTIFFNGWAGGKKNPKQNKWQATDSALE